MTESIYLVMSGDNQVFFIARDEAEAVARCIGTEDHYGRVPVGIPIQIGSTGFYWPKRSSPATKSPANNIEDGGDITIETFGN